LEKKKIFNKKERRFLGLKKLEENKSKNSKRRERMNMLVVFSTTKSSLRLKKLRTFIIRNSESKQKREELTKFIIKDSKISKINSLMNTIKATHTSSKMMVVTSTLLLAREHIGKDSRDKSLLLNTLMNLNLILKA